MKPDALARVTAATWLERAGVNGLVKVNPYGGVQYAQDGKTAFVECTITVIVEPAEDETSSEYAVPA